MGWGQRYHSLNKQLLTTQVSTARLFAAAGLYSEGSLLLNEALKEVEEARDDAGIADVLLGCSEVAWRAQQARKGGGIKDLQEIVERAMRSCQVGLAASCFVACWPYAPWLVMVETGHFCSPTRHVLPVPSPQPGMASPLAAGSVCLPAPGGWGLTYTA